MDMIPILITLLVYALVFGLIWYVIKLIPLPDPFGKIVQIVFAVVVVLALISMLTGYTPVLQIGRRI